MVFYVVKNVYDVPLLHKTDSILPTVRFFNKNTALGTLYTNLQHKTAFARYNCILLPRMLSAEKMIGRIRSRQHAERSRHCRMSECWENWVVFLCVDYAPVLPAFCISGSINHSNSVTFIELVLVLFRLNFVVWQLAANSSVWGQQCRQNIG